jgi:hypothetical protein
MPVPQAIVARSPADEFHIDTHAPRIRTRPMLIEQTSKRYKGAMAFGCFTSIFFGGLLLVSTSVASQYGTTGWLTVAGSMFGVLLGLFIFLIARGLAWWNHG